MNEFIALVLLCCVVVCDSYYDRHLIDRGLQTHPKLDGTNVRQKRASNQYGGNPYAPQYPNLQMATTYYFGPQPPVPQAYNQFPAVENKINNPGNILDHASRVLNMAQERYKMANPNMFPNQNLQMAVVLFYGPESPASLATLEHNENNRQINKQDDFDPNLVQQKKNIDDIFGPVTNTIDNKVGSKATPTLGDHHLTKTENQPLLTDAEVAENPYLSNYENAQAVLDDFFGTEKPVQRKPKSNESIFKDEPSDLKTDPIIEQQKNIEAMFGPASTKDDKETRRHQNTRKPVHANIPYEGALSLVSNSADIETTTLSEQDKAILDIFGNPPPKRSELSSQAPSPFIDHGSHPSSKPSEANNTEGDDYRFAAPHVLIEKYRSSISSRSTTLQTYSLYPLYTILFSLLFV